MSNATCITDGCEGLRYGDMGVCHPCYRRAYYRANKARMNAQAKAYAAVNSDRIKAQAAATYLANREAISAKHREYRLAHLDQEREAHRIYYLANREQIIATSTEANRLNPARAVKSVAKWRLKNPGPTREFSRRRHLRKRGVYVTKADYASVLIKWGMVCHICSGPIATMTALHFDHVIPLARGGAHVAENLRPSHAHCNLSKGTKILI